MSRGLTVRPRKLETKVGMDDDLEARIRRMSDTELFEHSKAVSKAIVASYGGLDEAVAGLRVETGGEVAEFILQALNSGSAAEFMEYLPGSYAERLVDEPLRTR